MNRRTDGIFYYLLSIRNIVEAFFFSFTGLNLYRELTAQKKLQKEYPYYLKTNPVKTTPKCNIIFLFYHSTRLRKIDTY